MKKRIETYPQRVLRRIEVDGRTTRQILRDVYAQVHADLPEEAQTDELIDEMNRLMARAYRLAVSGAPAEMLYRLADELFVIENTLQAILTMCAEA